MTAKRPILSRKLLQFLGEIRKNNNRDWFRRNKERYLQDVQEPMLQLVEELQDPLHRLSPHLIVVPKAMGGSLFRIYRDVRFSKDKTPYKSRVAARFPYKKGREASPLGLYLSIDPERCYVAGGSWRPPTPLVQSIRERIAAEPKAWKQAVGGAAFRKMFPTGLSGEELQRVPRPFAKDHPRADDLRRKDFIVVREIPLKKVTAADFPREILQTYQAMTPLMKFLAKAMQLDW